MTKLADEVLRNLFGLGFWIPIAIGTIKLYLRPTKANQRSGDSSTF